MASYRIKASGIVWYAFVEELTTLLERPDVVGYFLDAIHSSHNNSFLKPVTEKYLEKTRFL